MILLKMTRINLKNISSWDVSYFVSLRNISHLKIFLIDIFFERYHSQNGQETFRVLKKNIRDKVDNIELRWNDVHLQRSTYENIVIKHEFEKSSKVVGYIKMTNSLSYISKWCSLKEEILSIIILIDSYNAKNKCFTST